MPNSRQALARVLAILALLAAVVALTAVIGGSLGEDGSESRSGPAPQARSDRDEGKGEPDRGGEREIYVVQSGDTLTAIAATTGVTVAELLALNPDVDPQLLITGERLKLR